MPGTARPAFSFLLLGALRGWGDENGDKKVALQEAFDFTKDTMQGVMKTANRLPSMRGQTSVRLVVPARAARPDVASLVAGRCPSGWSWVGARCTEAPRVECPAVGIDWVRSPHHRPDRDDGGAIPGLRAGRRLQRT